MELAGGNLVDFTSDDEGTESDRLDLTSDDESTEGNPADIMSDDEPTEFHQTATTPEYLEWQEQVQAKLSVLELNMDPLMARLQYNMKQSPIYRSPDEVFIMIMRHLDVEDKAALFSLRQVSRR
ncbi:hypothetical protein ACHAPT_007521 [Fusarium lateritium]